MQDSKKVDILHERSSSIDKIEDITTAREHADQIANLSGIEATAASKAAWLISMTVSLGGLLFGMCINYSVTLSLSIVLTSFRLRHWLHLLGPRYYWFITRS
jgi:SP family myo-inositol transporter-like MFS transporter 13